MSVSWKNQLLINAHANSSCLPQTRTFNYPTHSDKAPNSSSVIGKTPCQAFKYEPFINHIPKICPWISGVDNRHKLSSIPNPDVTITKILAATRVCMCIILHASRLCPIPAPHLHKPGACPSKCEHFFLACENRVAPYSLVRKPLLPKEVR
jgi:hypothetical protein